MRLSRCGQTRPSAPDPRRPRWALGTSLRFHRVAGLLLAEQLVLADLGKVAVVTVPTALGWLFLRRFLRRSRRRGDNGRCGAVAVGRPPRCRADHLDLLLRVHAIPEVRFVAVDLLCVQIAHELQDFAAEYLTGH